MNWEMKSLGDLCHIEKGKIGIRKAIPGEFPLVVTGEERLSHNEFHFEGNAVIVPLVSSTGHGHKSLKRIHFQSGKFAVGNILCAVIPKDEKALRADYLYRFLFLNKEKELVSRMKGMANVTLPMKEIAKIEIPVPPIDAQIKFVQQYSVLEKKSNDLGEELTHQLDLVKQLRQAFLREAMQGKLLKSSPPLKEGWPQAGVVEYNINPSVLRTAPLEGEQPEKSSPPLKEGWPQAGVVEYNINPSVLRTAPLEGEQLKKSGLVAKRIHNLPHLKTFRKELRNNLTPAEAKLWTLLKGRQLDGKKFRRQFSVSNYILDFYCPSERLAIELDGQGHFEATQAEIDYERDLFLSYCGIKVLRFENKWVWDNPEGLLEEVRRNFNNPSVLRTAPLQGELPEKSSPPLKEGWPQAGVVQNSHPFKEEYPQAGVVEYNINPLVLRTAPLEGEQPENARDLLEKIKAEKERLIKEKKIKKQKPLPPIAEEEIPFEIPGDWVWCRLGEVGEINPRNNVDDDTHVGFCPMPLIYSEYGKNIDFVTRKWKDVKKNFTHIADNDVLVAKITPCFQNSKAALVKGLPNRYGAGTTELYVIRPFIKEMSAFIYSFIKTKDFLMEGERIMRGVAGQQRVPRDYVESHPLPLPPLSEQQRIVAKLDELMQYCDDLEASIKESQQRNDLLLQQVLREALEPGNNRHLNSAVAKE